MLVVMDHGFRVLLLTCIWLSQMHGEGKVSEIIFPVNEAESCSLRHPQTILLLHFFPSAFLYSSELCPYYVF